MDARLKNLSYSSMLTLHSCPKKYQLYKLNGKENDPKDPIKALSTSVTFAYGHIVGSGVQDILSGKTREETIWNMFLAWNPDLEDRDEKQKKSFYSAVIAIDRFINYRSLNNSELSGYEVIQYSGRLAVELGFCITFPDGFRYRGYVDVVLRHTATGEVLVLELKTTSVTNLTSATYVNSAQALGYSLILDHIFPGLSSYRVLYLVYKTKDYEFSSYNFPKSFVQRALWIRELLLDIETIKMYENAGVYPMHGESCYDYYRECEYLGNCTLSLPYITSPPPENPREEVFDVELTLADLIASQLHGES